ncbi:MAG: alpha-galactosidase [Clostridiales bacterium]|nr:alpha-galactosidase [Clostridiales bacterium]
MIIHDAQKHIFRLQGPSYSYHLTVQDGVLLHMYYGGRIEDEDLSALMPPTQEIASFDSPFSRKPLEVPTQEQGYFGQRALDVQNAQGDDVTALRYVSHRIFRGKKPLDGLPSAYDENDSETLEIDLADALTGLQVTLSYTVYDRFDVLARSMRVQNAGCAPLRIRQAGTLLPLPKNETGYDVLHLKGAWGRERQLQRIPLPRSFFSIDSRRGASGHENNPFLAVASRDATESRGEVYAITHVYSGSFRASTDVGVDDLPTLMIGLHPDVFSWTLAPGESFQAPEALLSYSDQGLNGMSHAFHPFIRQRICRGYWRDLPRPILVNNWEATYFGFDEEKLLAIARRAAEIGVELFVMDDGWFGRRDSDNCSLGDWVVDRRKLPHGLGSLAEKINGLGLRFGIWFEPEMVSPDSDLYRAHPDWCLHVDGRPRMERRQQLVLDMGRTEVQDYLIDAVENVLRSASISYVKWDMNRNMSEAFSAALPPERKMESQHRYMLGLYRVLSRLTADFPQVLFESCSGGGGRFDCGMLCYMPQTWTSDDTDAYQRIGIQWGTSLLYPCSTMGAHVSVVPNHQTCRVTPFEYRCHVALGGNFGFELDLSKMSPEDTAAAKDAVRLVKALRTVLQQGVYTRLVSPFIHQNLAAWQYVSQDGGQAVLCIYQHRSAPSPQPMWVRMDDLDPAARYRRTDTEETYTGGALMRVGVRVPYPQADYASWVIQFEKV